MHRNARGFRSANPYTSWILRPRTRSITLSLIFLGFCAAIILLWTILPSLSSRQALSAQDPLNQAYLTLITNEEYLDPALVFAYSLRNSGTSRKVIAMVTSEIGTAGREKLTTPGFFHEVISIDPVSNPNQEAQMLRANFKHSYTKLRCWEQTRFQKVIMMDADMLVLRYMDEIFDHPQLSAVEDCCNMFSSGLMVVQPSKETFNDMIDKIGSYDSYDGGDQGFLNTYFGEDWTKLPFHYNAIQTLYIDPNNRKAWDLQQPKIKVVHYMQEKPWKALNPKYPELARIHALWKQTHEKVKNELSKAH